MMIKEPLFSVMIAYAACLLLLNMPSDQLYRRDGFNSLSYPYTIGFILSAIEHILSMKQREDVEAHLANYNIPFQILQMVAEQCECAIEPRSNRKRTGKKTQAALDVCKIKRQGNYPAPADIS